MAVYFKFKSAKDYHSISIDGPFISIINLKERIFNSKLLGRGKDYDLIITNAQTNEDYLDEAILIPKNITVLIRRVPGPPCKPIVTQPDKPKVENQAEDDQPVKGNFKTKDSSSRLDIEGSEWDDVFGSSLYTTVSDSAPSSKPDEDDKINALVENSGLKQLNHHTEGFGPGIRSRRGGRGCGQGGWESKRPPPGYICHRCKVAGHFIQYCPTNGDPDYDIKKPLIGIPKPNEAAFEKEMEGLPSTRSCVDLPPELHCPLCKDVMKDAVLTSKCCFGSFCDKCIRDNIISNSMCVCGAKAILADDLIPNMTLRDTINCILESGSSSADNSGSSIQHKASACSGQPKIPSPTQSAASKGNQIVLAGAKESSDLKVQVDCSRHTDAPQQPVQSSGEEKIVKVPDVYEAAHESDILKNEDSALPVQEEGQQKVAAAEAGKKKRKKLSNPANTADMGWMGMQQPFMSGYMDPFAFNTYWPGMQHAVNEFWSPFGGSIPYNMGYDIGSFSNFIPSDPSGAQGFMRTVKLPPSQRELPRNCDYIIEGSSNAKVSSMQSKHKSPIARRSLNEECYNNKHDHVRSHKNKHTRSSLHHDHSHENQYKRSSLDHDHFSDQYNS